jgi:hypothetical protein
MKLGDNKSRTSFSHRSSSVPRNGSKGLSFSPDEVDMVAPVDYARDRPILSKGLLADKVRKFDYPCFIKCTKYIQCK